MAGKTNLFVQVCLTALLCFAPKISQSTHVVGGHLTYRCLGNEIYEFSFFLYRDCEFGIPFHEGLEVHFYREVNFGNGYEYFAPDYLPLDSSEIEFIPPVINNPCLGPPEGICVEKGVYRSTAFLPGWAGDYKASIIYCCRNETITN
ncbi:MAG: hypothetical protein AAFV80_24050, partial [Bacteroidota bacterium]